MLRKIKDELRVFAPICLFYLLAICIVGIQGQFPLNDDWTYGLSVLDLLKHGSWNMEYSSTPCYLHISAGYLVSKVFGFSYPALRLFTLSAGLLCTAFIYLTAQELRLGKNLAVLSALLFAVNPIALNLSFSFMTDVSAIAFCCGYTYFFVRWIKFDGRLNLIAALLFLIAAMAIRYSCAVYVPVCFLYLILLRQKNSVKSSLGLVALVLVPSIFFWGVTAFSSSAGDNQNFHIYGAALKSILVEWVQSPVEAFAQQEEAFGNVFLYMGLFLAPLLGALHLKEWISRQNRVGKRISVAVILLSLAFVVQSNFNEVIVQHKMMPLSANIMRLPQVGVLSIMIADLPDLNNIFRKMITVIAVIFASMAVASLVVVAARLLSWKNQKLNLSVEKNDCGSDWEFQLFLVVNSVFCSSLVALQMQVLSIDRYLLAALPPVILLSGYTIRMLGIKVNWRLASFLVIVVGGFSIAATQDYLSWNRARWRVIGILQNKGVASCVIDGGYEYNLWNDPSLYRVTRPRAKLFQFVQPEGIVDRAYRWWPTSGERFVISFAPISEYKTVREEPYFSLLFMTEKKVYLLEKIAK